MCLLCEYRHASASASADASLNAEPPFYRRQFLRQSAAATAALVGTSAWSQVNVGESSRWRNAVPAEALEQAAAKQYIQVLQEAKEQNALLPESHPQAQRLRQMALRLLPYTPQWNARAKDWRWNVQLISSKQINAWCMPGGKIAFYTGILEQLKLTDDEAAMVMGHEMAHALREHARERVAKSQVTGAGLSILSQLLGLGQAGDIAANLGSQLLTLKYSRDDESEADLVGLEIAARAGYNPEASVVLWQKMQSANKGGMPQFMSSHPSSDTRIHELQANIPKVMGLYEQSPQRKV